MICRNGFSRLPEDKIELFVLFLPSEALFSVLLRTKVGFLSFLSQFLLVFGPVRGQNQGFCPHAAFPNRTFQPSRAQNWHFCALLGFPRALFWPFERKSWVFARFCLLEEHFYGLSSAKVMFLRAFHPPNRTFSAIRAQNCTFCALLGFPMALFRPSERNTRLFARFCPSRRHVKPFSSAKPDFLRAWGTWF